MGVGGKKPAMHEIDDTRGSARDDQFDMIVERIKAVAGEFKDETSPLYADMGQEEAEIGEQRMVTFNINKFDFQLTRNTEHYRIAGENRGKNLEEMKPPRVTMKLRRKSQYDQDWQVVDLEDLF